MPTNSPFYSFTTFAHYPVIQGYFDRTIGSVTTDHTLDVKALGEMATILSVRPTQIKLMNQVHTASVAVVTANSPQISMEVDGLVTQMKDVILGVKTADCLPIIFYDPVHKIGGICHAGFKGLLAGVIEETVSVMKRLGAIPTDMLVGIGPHICGNCYTVNADRIAAFIAKYPKLTDFYLSREDDYLLDLQKVALYSLNDVGITGNHIEVAPYCTNHMNDLFFSRRAEKTGIFLTVLGMK